MVYLHKQDIIHRDLKPANILLDKYLFPKISDFGMSKFISEKEKEKVKYSKIKIKTSGFKGTYAYSAPEVIKNSIYSKAGDVYAFGMIVYEIMTNEIPFDGLNFYQFISKTYNDYHPEFKYPIHYCYRKLIESCWRKDYLYRPDFDDIVKNLETNKNFITNTVNEDEYRNYISFINQQKQIMPDSSSAKPNNKFVKVTFDLNNDKTIEQKVESSNFYLDLSKYERQNNMSKSDFCKLYRFQDKETKNIYFGQMSMMTINQIKKDELRKFEKEIKIIKELNHPSLLKLIGFSPFDFKKQLKPVIVTEYVNNGSLENILELERANNKIPGWNETKKLINIFGITSGMAYLHSKNIIHKSLSTSTIYLDDILAPKIGDFGLSTRFSFSSSITHESISGIKATPIYASPEVLTSNEYSQSSDVYSFSFIVYELVTNEIPFEEIIDKNQIFEEIVVNKNRPEIKEKVSNSYCNLIEKCWSQEPSERPTFDEIVSMLKNDQGFITDKINKEDYHTYVDFIEHQIETPIKIEEKVEPSNEKIKEEEETFRIISVGENNVENLEFLSKKSINENDVENIYKYLCMLIEKGKYTIPLEYSVKLYKSKQFHQSFNYFTLLSKMNNPIALYFIGRMKFYGEGCIKNEEESYKILKHLSDNGIDQATEFLENNFLIKSG